MECEEDEARFVRHPHHQIAAVPEGTCGVTKDVREIADSMLTRGFQSAKVRPFRIRVAFAIFHVEEKSRHRDSLAPAAIPLAPDLIEINMINQIIIYFDEWLGDR
jgi:hypothetical protein